MAYAPAREEFLDLLEHLGLTDHSRAGDLPGPPPGRIRPGVRGGTREHEITETVDTLKALAVRLEIPIVVSADLDRLPGARSDRLPDLHTDLCDPIARTADLVVLVHREDAAERDSSRAGEADLIVAKHRNGPTATITVAFQGHYGRFVDMPPD
ncbi:DnaB-like helicase C-terminal domain-containing protein [Streptosporangium longisporum]|uniref:SF4 helicase domain-containing protein n=1 Tax=Streptosporangium longisporum TaxID=46187 RepID=A0ABN3XQA2_9ACTN